ncbi:MAG TPA: cystathionine beta-synthase, partial [Anaerolineales bacterium]|nr:cystathionine beta-synthase [Anaerolineales bacterium]
TVGNTPLVHLNRLGRDLACALYAKVESFNPGGSVKDRIAVNIIAEAERSGRLKPGGTVVESTSGNTGVGLAIVCAKKGYRTVFVMPDKMSQEKIQLLRAFGAKVVITPTAVAPEDPRSYYNVAKRIVSETPNAILANQYHNPENPRSHYLTTGPEIWEQTQGKVTDVVIGMGTGGTISGIGRYLKEQNQRVRIIGVDPVGSLLLETWQQGRLPPGGEALPYKVEGIGEDFLPSTLDLSVIDEVIQIGERESFVWARRLVKEEGIFCGGSSGTALAAAMHYASGLGPDHLVVVLLPDSGSRYLSKFYDDKWMKENGFLETEWSQVQLMDVLAAKRRSLPVSASAELISVQTSDRITDVIALLKAHDISQVPVLHPDGSLAGLVAEVDLLKFMLENDPRNSVSATVAAIAAPAEAVFPSTELLEAALPAILEGYVALVTQDRRPVGILTKIDLLDFLAQKI